jgi:hypothetical protein
MPDPSQMTDSQIEDANALLHDYHVAKENESEKEVVHGQDDGGMRTPRKNGDNTQPLIATLFFSHIYFLITQSSGCDAFVL